MNTWLSFTSLLLAAVAGLLRSRQGSTLRLYFLAQLLNVPVVFLAARYLGDRTTVYALLYVAVTLPVLECCCFMLWDAGLNALHLRIAVAFGLFMGMIESFGMARHPAVDYVTFAEGVLLSMVGTAMVLGMPPHTKRHMIGVLSLALSCYDFAWLRNDNWAGLNDWLPSLLCTAAFVRIILMRREKA